MPTYRLYQLDGAGKIVSAEWIEADADGEALERAHDRVDGSRYELWQRERLVGSNPKQAT